MKYEFEHSLGHLGKGRHGVCYLAIQQGVLPDREPVKFVVKKVWFLLPRYNYYVIALFQMQQGFKQFVCFLSSTASLNLCLSFTSVICVDCVFRSYD